MKKSKKKFNWLTRLNQLARAKTLRFKPRDYDKLVHKSGDWPTCACGQLCKALPRSYFGVPEDTKLSELGLTFHTRVKRRKWLGALETFRKIERRSAKLLAAQRGERAA